MIRLSVQTIKVKNKNGEIEIKFIDYSRRSIEELTTESKLAKTTHPEIFISRISILNLKNKNFMNLLKILN